MRPHLLSRGLLSWHFVKAKLKSRRCGFAHSSLEKRKAQSPPEEKVRKRKAETPTELEVRKAESERFGHQSVEKAMARRHFNPGQTKQTKPKQQNADSFHIY